MKGIELVAGLVGLTSAIQVELERFSCPDNSAECLAHKLGVSIKEFCYKHSFCTFPGKGFCEGYPNVIGCEEFETDCCKEWTAECRSCQLGVSEDVFCLKHNMCTEPGEFYCEGYPVAGCRDDCCDDLTAECRACNLNVT